MDSDTAAYVSNVKRCKLYQGFSQAKLGTLTFLFLLFYWCQSKTCCNGIKSSVVWLHEFSHFMQESQKTLLSA